MRASTKNALLRYRAAWPPDRRSYAKMAYDLRLTPADAGLLCDVLHWPERRGHVKPAREDRLRAALGLAVGRPARRTIQVRPATHAALAAARRPGEAFDALLWRLVTEARDAVTADGEQI